MYLDKRILALIPARGGSKGIKNKNITLLHGKPLIAYTVEAAIRSVYVDDVVVSTDSYEIAEVAKAYGAKIPFMRPDEFAQDDSKTIDVVIHAIQELSGVGRYDALILLQPTQPLRNKEDIDLAIETYFRFGEKSLVSISEVDDHPLLIRQIGEDGKLTKLLKSSSTCRRQDMPTFYRVNGCIYINKISEINEETSFNDNEIPYVMKRENSVDIDEPIDLALAEYYLKDNSKRRI